MGQSLTKTALEVLYAPMCGLVLVTKADTFEGFLPLSCEMPMLVQLNLTAANRLLEASVPCPSLSRRYQ